jgi:16S rRNA (adenine1518-N6/adenine1519-N6)-dimethyltransferase
MPSPRVDSALVSFSLRAPARRGGEDEAGAPLAAPAADERVLASVIGAAFTQRRKKLRNALAPLFGGDADATAAALASAGVDPDGRADAAGVRDFVRAADAAVLARAGAGGAGGGLVFC